MGITALPTAAQRQNEKSGVALEKIQTQQAIGSFHFTDNFDRSLENCGRQIDELITKVMDTERQVAIRNADESHSLMNVVPGGQPSTQQEPDAKVLDPQAGEFDVTISTGPSYQSQREEATEFADMLVRELKNLPIAPPQQAKLLSMAIKLKSLGPRGDEMAKIIDPPQEDGQQMPPQAQQALQQLQQHNQALNAACQTLEKQLGQLHFEKTAKVVESQAKLQQIAAQSQADMALEDKKLQTQIAVAEIETKAQILSEREAALRDLESQWHSQAHDVATQAMEQQHAAQMQQQQGQQQQDMAAQQADSQSQQSAQDAAQSQAQQEAQAQQQPAQGE